MSCAAAIGCFRWRPLSLAVVDFLQLSYCRRPPVAAGRRMRGMHGGRAVALRCTGRYPGMRLGSCRSMGRTGGIRCGVPQRRRDVFKERSPSPGRGRSDCGIFASVLRLGHGRRCHRRRHTIQGEGMAAVPRDHPSPPHVGGGFHDVRRVWHNGEACAWRGSPLAQHSNAGCGREPRIGSHAVGAREPVGGNRIYRFVRKKNHYGSQEESLSAHQA